MVEVASKVLMPKEYEDQINELRKQTEEDRSTITALRREIEATQRGLSESVRVKRE